MNFLFVIPARGGSKGIPYKNIYPLCGKPLLAYTIESMENVKFSGDIVVSTDDSRIAETARQLGHVTVISRPAHLATDKSKTEDALIHAVSYMKMSFGKTYDAVITLQATSPLRRSSTIQCFIDTFESQPDCYDALLSLSEDRSDFWVRLDNGRYRRLNPEAPRRRQDRSPLYVENSALYATKTEALLETCSVLGRNANGFLMDAGESIDINEPIDIVIAEQLLKNIGEK